MARTVIGSRLAVDGAGHPRRVHIARIGCAEATDNVDPLRVRRAQGLERGASSFARGGGRAAVASRAAQSEEGKDADDESDPGVAGDPGYPVGVSYGPFRRTTRGDPVVERQGAACGLKEPLEAGVGACAVCEEADPGSGRRTPVRNEKARGRGQTARECGPGQGASARDVGGHWYSWELGVGTRALWLEEVWQPAASGIAVGSDTDALPERRQPARARNQPRR